MNRYIDVDKIEDWAMQNFGVVIPEYYDIIDAYEDLRADVEPVVHAHWDVSMEKIGKNWFAMDRCSNCSRLKPVLVEEDELDFKYCPDCGAKMDEVTE